MQKLKRLIHQAPMFSVGHRQNKQPSEAPGSSKPARVVPFAGSTDAAPDKLVLGGKGAGLVQMVRLGLPVPPGFVITTECCKAFMKNGSDGLPEGLKDEYLAALRTVERDMGKSFGDPHNPLLVSVRSGAPASMPGMMDTVLNLGMNDAVAEQMAGGTGNPRFVHDTHRRFLQMFSDVVQGVPREKFEEAISEMKERRGVKKDIELSADDLKELVQTFKTINPNVPSDPYVQLEAAIKAVFKSWFNPRAVRYRQYNQIPNDWGTAVNVQAMVFGNMNDDSGTGVAFSRNPANGDRVFFGEFLPNAEGEDVVAGIRTPLRLAQLRELWPAVYEELEGYQRVLESHYRDMQDLEFTIENGKLYMLQCRTGKRTAKAAAKIAVDMVREGLITEEEALLRIDPNQTEFFLHPTIDPDAPRQVVGKGLPASPGAATGEVVFTPDEAEALAKAGRTVILCRRETTPEDIHGMKAAAGILTQFGGMTSHAAVVARAMGKCCVSGAGNLHIDIDKGEMRCGGNGTSNVAAGSGNEPPLVIRAGHVVTLDGLTGEVLEGDVARRAAGEDADFQQILRWANKRKRMGVLTNADTPEDARNAVKWGAQGIGLCRTEHMFFSPERIDQMRAMILSETKEERQKYLDKLFEFQRDDMVELFTSMDGKPVTIRLLDPPLHEFLPTGNGAIEHLAAITGQSVETVRQRCEEMKESNPMLGLRGCRLTMVHPEITEMQVKAIMTAAVVAKQQRGATDPRPEIMIPLVASAKELGVIMPIVRAAADAALAANGNADIPYKMGTMMELPRACVRADELAATGVTFMSFGTNDLTQTVWGFSRDDSAAFVGAYIEQGALAVNPFVSIDQDGVGALIRMAVRKARGYFPGMQMGICGEHGGECKSVEYFHRESFDYVSCSPFRVPIACIAAGQAAVREDIEQAKNEGKGKAGGVAAASGKAAAADNQVVTAAPTTVAVGRAAGEPVSKKSV